MVLPKLLEGVPTSIDIGHTIALDGILLEGRNIAQVS